MTERDSSPQPQKSPAELSALRGNECGDLGISIDREGTWYYQGSPIGRRELVKLFASVLWRDDDGVHWMTTPVEHGTVQVEDVAYVAVEMQVEGAGRDQIIRLRTNIDDWVEVGPDHPLRVVHDPDTGEPSPYVGLWKGLEARLARPIYYDLVALAVDGKGPPPPDEANGSPENRAQGGEVVGVWSKGTFFILGTIPADA